MTIRDAQQMYANEASGRTLDRLKKMSRAADEAPAVNAKKNQKLYDACIQFESIFIKQMLAAMRKSVAKSGFLHGGMAEDIFEDMLYDEYSLLMAKNARFGLADIVYRQLNPYESGIIGPPRE